MTTPVNQPVSGTVSIPQPGPAPTDGDIDALAGQIKTMVDAAAASGVTISQATIAATALTASPPTVSITMSGSTVQVDGVSFMEGFTPSVGDNVAVLKQSNAILVLGHVADTGTATATDGGWIAPGLLSGFTTVGNSNGPIMYRFVMDDGSPKVQWKGSVAHTGSNTAIISGMGALYTPSAKVSVLAARDPGGGSNVVGIDFTSGGAVNLVGPTTAPNSASGGNTGDESALHSHNLGSSDTQLSGYLSQAGSDLGHAHGLGNSGTELQVHHHGVPGPSITVTAPVWISFNGIEYFL